jgi:hypothetical protein
MYDLYTLSINGQKLKKKYNYSELEKVEHPGGLRLGSTAQKEQKELMKASKATAQELGVPVKGKQSKNKKN